MIHDYFLFVKHFSDFFHNYFFKIFLNIFITLLPTFEISRYTNNSEIFHLRKRVGKRFVIVYKKRQIALGILAFIIFCTLFAFTRHLRRPPASIMQDAFQLFLYLFLFVVEGFVLYIALRKKK